MKKGPVIIFSYTDHHRYHDIAHRSKWQCQFQVLLTSPNTVFTTTTKSLGFLMQKVDALFAATS